MTIENPSSQNLIDTIRKVYRPKNERDLPEVRFASALQHLSSLELWRDESAGDQMVFHPFNTGLFRNEISICWNNIYDRQPVKTIYMSGPGGAIVDRRKYTLFEGIARPEDTLKLLEGMLDTFSSPQKNELNFVHPNHKTEMILAAFRGTPAKSRDMGYEYRYMPSFMDYMLFMYDPELRDTFNQRISAQAEEDFAAQNI